MREPDGQARAGRIDHAAGISVRRHLDAGRAAVDDDHAGEPGGARARFQDRQDVHHHAVGCDKRRSRASATPFLRLATGASGVGLASSLGLAFAAGDTFGEHAPKVHIIEGEGGLTPGRVAEALAAAGTASLGNAILHVDWNQASIDSNRVCRDGDVPGDYVQWDPLELAYLNDWNVIYVPGGFDFNQILAAQQTALGWTTASRRRSCIARPRAGSTASRAAPRTAQGTSSAADAFFGAVAPLLEESGDELPRCPLDSQLCQGGQDRAVIEQCAWDALLVVRRRLESDPQLTQYLAGRLLESRAALAGLGRRSRAGAPRVEAVFEAAREILVAAPEEQMSKAGSNATLRGELAQVLAHCNRRSGGALLAAAADLLGSTSVNVIGESFPPGFFNAQGNPGARTLSLGGICEDGATGILAGISTFGHHVGVVSSYGAFLAPLAHIGARLHAIGCQARQAVSGDPFKPLIVICAHAGLTTGEDGPTHADPQALQLLQENFPRGTVVTLTPWEPREVWTLFAAALERRPAVIAPFVTRPADRVPDRARLGLAPPEAAATGVYKLRAARGRPDGVVVLQESGVVYTFVNETLALLEKSGIDLDVYYVASAELFDLSSPPSRSVPSRPPRPSRRWASRGSRCRPRTAGSVRPGAASTACIRSSTGTSSPAARARRSCGKQAWTATASSRPSGATWTLASIVRRPNHGRTRREDDVDRYCQRNPIRRTRSSVARVTPQRLVARIEVQVDQARRARLVGPFERVEGLVEVADRGVAHREVFGAHVLSAATRSRVARGSPPPPRDGRAPRARGRSSRRTSAPRCRGSGRAGTSRAPSRRRPWRGARTRRT